MLHLTTNVLLDVAEYGTACDEPGAPPGAAESGAPDSKSLSPRDIVVQLILLPLEYMAGSNSILESFK